MKKKIMALLLTIVMIVTFMPTMSVSALETTYYIGPEGLDLTNHDGFNSYALSWY